jgi:glycosyltransferase involved in cell wall biosynthesis
VKLHTVFITYNRRDLSERALVSYFNTVSVPHTVVIADNGSSDGTQEWIAGLFRDQIIMGYVQFKTNVYPGPACNEGFAKAPDDATHLHRADNDFEFLPGWCDEVERSFGHIRKLGQLGLRTPDEENSSVNVGGNCVIDRRLWDAGLRWDERPWPQLAEEVGHGWTEDSLMSKEVRNRGWTWGRVRAACIAPIGAEDPTDPYYVQSWRDRRIHEDLLRRNQAP